MTAITNLFEESVQKFSENPFLWEKKTDQFKALTYSEVKVLVNRFAAGLMSLGISKGDRLALLAEGRNEWVIGELGMLYAGAVNVPLSVKLSEMSEIKFRLEHSGTRMVITSQYQAKKLTSLLGEMPGIEKIILIDEQTTYSDKEISFAEVLRLGEEFLKTNKAAFDERWQSVYPNDYATICYTSGTTADPKGIVLTHRNYTANTEQALGLIDVPEYYVTLLILPWDHSFAHTGGIYTVAKAGASLASVQPGKTPMETLKNIPINIREIRPHFILSVPALAKNFKKNIETGISAKGKIIENLFKAGLNVAYAYNDNGFNRGKGWRMLLLPLVKLFDKIIFTKIRENFGNRIEFFVGGGALLDIELQKFFYAIGIPILQGYGLTEAAPIISANSLKKHKMGTSGQIVPMLEHKICDDKGNLVPMGEKGEIIVKGENVMAGYWKNNESTSQTIIDGWLHTGDMGYFDKDGFIYVLGRFKSLLIGDDGEKFSPESIEETIVGQSHFIDQCMLYNNQNPYTVAIVVPNKEAIRRYLKEKHVPAKEEITQALKLIEQEVNEYRSGRKFGNIFPQRWLPVSIAIIDEAFTEDNKLINSTLKLVRSKVTEKYANRIKYLYTPEAKDICNQANQQAMIRWFSF
jgi:long-chain acyl-CoA synthetase